MLASHTYNVYNVQEGGAHKVLLRAGDLQGENL